MTNLRPALLLVAGAAVAGAIMGASTAVIWLAPLVLALAAALGLAVWRNPVVGAVVVVAFVPALSGLARGLVVPSLKISELLLVLCVGAMLLSRPRRWRAATGVDVGLVVFALVGLGFALFHAYGGSSELESVLRVGLQPTFLLMTWWAASRGVVRSGDLTVVLRWLLVVSVVPGLLAVLQFFDVGGVAQLLVDLTSDGVLDDSSRLQSDRVTGPFPIWHSLGGYLLVPVVLAATLLLRGDRTVLPRGWLVAVLLLLLTALVMSVTVTLLLWLPVAFLVAAALAGRFRWGLAMTVVLACAAALAFPDLLGERVEDQQRQSTYTAGGVLPQTVEYRILVWERDYLPLVNEAAAAGLGNDPPADVVFGSTENQYLSWVLRGGVLLVLAAAVGVGAIAVRSWRHARAPDESRPDDGPPSVARSAAMATFGILVYLPAALMIWPYLTNAGLPQALFAFAGAALAREPWRPSRFASRVLSPARAQVPLG